MCSRRGAFAIAPPPDKGTLRGAPRALPPSARAGPVRSRDVEPRPARVPTGAADDARRHLRPSTRRFRPASDSEADSERTADTAPPPVAGSFLGTRFARSLASRDSSVRLALSRRARAFRFSSAPSTRPSRAEDVHRSSGALVAHPPRLPPFCQHPPPSRALTLPSGNLARSLAPGSFSLLLLRGGAALS